MFLYFINLDKDLDRKEFMENQCQKLGIDFERIPGVMGVDIRHDTQIYDSAKAISLNGHDLSLSEIGCAYSHLLAYKKILEQNAPWAIVCEDDVLFPDNFKEVLNKLDMSSYEYVSFDYPEGGIVFIKHWIRSAVITSKGSIKKTLLSILKFLYIAPMITFEAVRNYLYRVFHIYRPALFLRPLYFAGCYAISKKGAEKLYTLGLPLYCAADRLPNQARKQRKLVFRGFVPQIVTQQREVFKSNIAEKYVK